jgi:hypothetical protein
MVKRETENESQHRDQSHIPPDPLHPAIGRPTVEQRDPTVCSARAAINPGRQDRAAENDPAHRSPQAGGVG